MYLSEWLSSKSLQITHVGEDAEKKRFPSTLLVGMEIGAIKIENGMEVPQRTKNRIIYDPAVPLLGIYIQKKILIQKGLCIPILIAVSSIWKFPG